MWLLSVTGLAKPAKQSPFPSQVKEASAKPALSSGAGGLGRSRRLNSPNARVPRLGGREQAILTPDGTQVLSTEDRALRGLSEGRKTQSFLGSLRPERPQFSVIHSLPNAPVKQPRVHTFGSQV